MYSPEDAAKNAYRTPLTVSRVEPICLPSRVIARNVLPPNDVGQHPAQALGAGGGRDTEAEPAAAPLDRLERGAVATVEPGEHLATETTGTPRAFADATIASEPVGGRVRPCACWP